MASSTLWLTGLRGATRTSQLALTGIVIYAVLIGDIGLLVNTGIMLGISLVPDGLRYWYDLPPKPVIAFLVAVVPLLHAIGTMGPYRTVPAFDQFAHAVASLLVAGLGYVIVSTLDADYEAIEVPPKLRFGFVLIFATSFGVIWESLEFALGLLTTVFGGKPLLAQYGPTDVVLDLLFNSIGALVLAVWGTPYFDGLRRLAVRRFGDS